MRAVLESENELASPPCEVNDATTPCLAQPDHARPHLTPPSLTSPDHACEQYTGSLCVLDLSGHSRMQWDRKSPQQVAAAKARFDELRARGYLAYKLEKDGGQGEVITQFDPNAERLVMNAPMVGG
jgi:hypothetical protein